MSTFTHGSSARVHANGNDLSSYLNTAGVEASADTAETTAFSDTAKTYIAGLKDATLSAEGMFAGTINQVDQILEAALGDNNSEASYFPSGDAIGAFGYGMDCQETAYSVTSPVDGVVSVSAAAQASSGAERIVSQHAYGAETAAGTATAVNHGAATTTGYVGYLHSVLNGSTATVKIQHSTDDNTYADLFTFDGLTAGTASQRLAAAGTVNQYTRSVWTVTGTSVTFGTGLGRTPNL